MRRKHGGMTTDFDVNKYWLERGRTYLGEHRTPPEFHRLQEHLLLDVLKRGNIPMKRVLELGCGFGRITRLLAREWPEAAITALDRTVGYERLLRWTREPEAWTADDVLPDIAEGYTVSDDGTAGHGR